MLYYEILNFQIEYQKQKKEAINNYRGFQTMDSKDHPVVQRGIKAAEITSNVSWITTFDLPKSAQNKF